MNLTKHEQLNLIRKIEDMVGNIGDYLYEENDASLNRQIDCIENTLDVLKQSFYDENTYIKFRDRETGEFEYQYFEQGDIGSLCYNASKFYAWSDYDNTYEIVDDGEKEQMYQVFTLYEYKKLIESPDKEMHFRYLTKLEDTLY